MHTGVAEAAICLGLAVGMVETLGAHAAKAVHLVYTRAPVVAGAGRALVDIGVTAGAWRGETTLTEQRLLEECWLCTSARTHTETAQGSQGSSMELTCLRALLKPREAFLRDAALSCAWKTVFTLSKYLQTIPESPLKITR